MLKEVVHYPSTEDEVEVISRMDAGSTTRATESLRW